MKEYNKAVQEDLERYYNLHNSTKVELLAQPVIIFLSLIVAVALLVA